MAGAEMDDQTNTDDRNALRIDTDRLSENELEELARLVVRKIKTQIRQERDRIGRS